MSTERPRMDRDTEALLQNLMATPVGRRWLLKAGLGSAAAIAAAHLPLPVQVRLGRRMGSRLQPGQAASAASEAPRRQPGQPDHRQDPALRARAGHVRRQWRLQSARWSPTAPGCPWSRTPPPRAPRSRPRAACLPLPTSAPSTHYVQDVPLPSDRAVLVSVQGTRGNDQVLVSQMLHTPPADHARPWPNSPPAAATVCAAWSARTSACRRSASPPRRSPRRSTSRSWTSIGDAQSTAVAMAMLHPNVATNDPTSATRHQVPARPDARDRDARHLHRHDAEPGQGLRQVMRRSPTRTARRPSSRSKTRTATSPRPSRARPSS